MGKDCYFVPGLNPNHFINHITSGRIDSSGNPLNLTFFFQDGKVCSRNFMFEQIRG